MPATVLIDYQKLYAEKSMQATCGRGSRTQNFLSIHEMSELYLLNETENRSNFEKALFQEKNPDTSEKKRNMVKK